MTFYEFINLAIGRSGRYLKTRKALSKDEHLNAFVDIQCLLKAKVRGQTPERIVQDQKAPSAFQKSFVTV
jgi:hypothetical protein